MWCLAWICVWMQSWCDFAQVKLLFPWWCWGGDVLVPSVGVLVVELSTGAITGVHCDLLPMPSLNLISTTAPWPLASHGKVFLSRCLLPCYFPWTAPCMLRRVWQTNEWDSCIESLEFFSVSTYFPSQDLSMCASAKLRENARPVSKTRILAALWFRTHWSRCFMQSVTFLLFL
jgi:hypothetical protein